MNKDNIIHSIAIYIESKFKDEGSGHDWWHIYRVWKSSQHIAKKEGGDMLIISLAALLHEIDDPKLSGNDKPADKIRSLLKEYYVDEVIVKAVINIVETISFRNSFSNIGPDTLEGKIVQDADRLDAMGAIGIARTFSYGGNKGRIMYDPEHPPEKHRSKEAYSNSDGPTINHFYEKLLLLKDKMNTDTAKEMAAGRHQFMEEYLDRFYKEWEGTL